jgi:outer membrane protein assembly factor BamB
MSIDHLIFVGFNARVAALNRKTGDIVWKWLCPRPYCGYVTLLLDGDLLVVSVNGYIFGLDPATGEQLWHNETKGFGVGVASLVSMHGSPSGIIPNFAASQAAQYAATNVGYKATM